jgi:hypothetical protein
LSPLGRRWGEEGRLRGRIVAIYKFFEQLKREIRKPGGGDGTVGGMKGSRGMT